MSAEKTATPNHREWLYMGIGWGLMDLRQDIEFAGECMDELYDWRTIVKRLGEMEDAVADYADAHFPVVASEKTP